MHGPRFAVDGVEIIPKAMSEDDLVPIARFIDLAVESKAGARSFEPDANIARLIAIDGTLGVLACWLMNRTMHAVRVLCFDKTPTSNWSVPWHQDRTIAVRECRETDGFGPWSVKAGVPHVEPPVEILQGMLALRLHVDPCPSSNGALEVLLGSWSWGRLTVKAVAERSASESSYLAQQQPVTLLRCAG